MATEDEGSEIPRHLEPRSWFSGAMRLQVSGTLLSETFGSWRFSIRPPGIGFFPTRFSRPASDPSGYPLAPGHVWESQLRRPLIDPWVREPRSALRILSGRGRRGGSRQVRRKRIAAIPRSARGRWSGDECYAASSDFGICNGRKEHCHVTLVVGDVLLIGRW